ncbi:MAG: 2Fe-2S iron-sulfur cluster binding domain-containing protein [Calothrix sp. FI2-JRJ7]|nr:2Fe-2S iron-sulfur cluster binding domain-containing protein [Calothrix sp. FI2-JRJ7]
MKLCKVNSTCKFTEKVIAQKPPTPSYKAVPSVSEVINVTLRVNGKKQALKIEPRVTLLDALREYIGFTGTKKGCDHGQCGACTVLVGGRRINSCLTLACMHDGDEITTIEGLAKGEELHPMQAAFIRHDGFQCGYCTSGQICSAGTLYMMLQVNEFESYQLHRISCYDQFKNKNRNVEKSLEIAKHRRYRKRRSCKLD